MRKLLINVVCGLMIGAVAAWPAPPKFGPAARVDESYGKLPLSFEANQGQTDSRVKFLSRGRGYALFLTATEAVLSLKRGQAPAVLRMRLVGANRAPQVTALEELPGRSNIFIGKDPAKWRTNISDYARVLYHDVYPGVDLVYYGHQGQLEFDFAVRPGADPKLIRLAFQGTDKLEVDARGDLLLDADGGEVRFRRPVVYQEKEGVREEIAGAYVLRAKHQVGFEVAAYDASRPLVIDPTLAYSTYLGGSGDDQGNAIAVDAAGNAYVTGSTASTNFPTASPLPGSSNRSKDVFVAKLNAAGSALIYSTYLGGSADEAGFGIAVDASGNAYVTGYTESSNFPTASPLRATYSGLGDAFVAKLNATGSVLVYSTYLGGNNADAAYGIAVDSSGNAYVTGITESTNFPTASPLQAGNSGERDAFVAKLSSAGSFVYSTYLGGSGDDRGSAIAVDSTGNAYVAGYTESSNFPTASPLRASYSGLGDAFVAKLNAAGSALVYSTYLGGNDYDQAGGIAVDSSGNVYVTGFTYSGDFPTVSPLQLRLNQGVVIDCFDGCPDSFVAKLNPAGSALVYSTYLGGYMNDIGSAIAVDSSGNAYVTGFTDSTGFYQPDILFPSVNPLQASSMGNSGTDAFVAKLNATGSALVYSTYLGGIGDDFGNAIAVDSTGNAYVAGSSASVNFPTTSALQPASGGGGDAFIAKINPGGASCAYSISPTSQSFPLSGGTGSVAVTAPNGCAWLAVSSDDWLTVTSGSSGVGSATVNYSVAANTGASRGGTLSIAGQTFTATQAAAPLPPTIALSPGSLSFSAQQGGANPASQTVAVSNSGGGTLNWTAAVTSGPWLSVSPASGTNSGTLAVSANINGLSAGTYNGVITVSATGATNTPQTIGVALAVTGPSPTIALSANSLSFRAQEDGANPAGQTVTVSNSGGGTLSWTATVSSGAWLRVSPASGTGTGTLTVSANTTGLAAGTFNGTIQVAASGATNTPQTISVTLTVTAPPPPPGGGGGGGGAGGGGGGGGGPDFTLGVSPLSQSVPAGAAATYTVNINASGGFTKSVTLSCNGLPVGASCSFSPNPAPPGIATLTVTTSATTPLTAVTFAVFGVSDFGRSAGAELIVVPPDFALAVSPHSQSVIAGAAATYKISVTALGAFTNAVELSCSGLPAGAACRFSPNPAPPGNSTLTVSTPASMPLTTVTFTVFGIRGDVLHTSTAELKVSAPDFALGLSPSSQSVTVGAAATYAVSITAVGGFNPSVSLACSSLPAGASCSFSPNPAPPGTATLTVSTESNTLPGTVTFTVTGTSGSLLRTATASLSVRAIPEFALDLSPSSQSVSPGGAVTYTVSVTFRGGFSAAVSLSCSGLPAGATCAFSPNPVSPGLFSLPGNSVLTLSTASDTPAGTVAFTVTATSGSLTRTATAGLTVSGFTVSVAPSSQSVAAGAAATYTVSIGAIGGSSASVSLSCSALPAGASCSFSPNPAPPGTSTLSVSTAATTPAGSVAFTVTGAGGSLTRTVTAGLTVGAPSGTPVLTSASITNGASFAAGVTPGSIATIFGTRLTKDVTGIVLADRLPLPAQLKGTSVTVSGLAAPLFAVANVDGREQINLQVPYEVTGQPAATIVVNNNGLTSAPVQVDVLLAHPGIFTVDGSAGAILHGSSFQPVAPSNPAAAGEAVVLYATGLGPVSPAPPNGMAASASPLSRTAIPPVVTLGGLPAEVLFSGLAPGFVGLYQVNVVIPLSAPSGILDVVIRMGDQASKAVKIAVK